MHAASRLLKGLVATVLVVVGAGLLVFLLQLVVPTQRDAAEAPVRAAAPSEPEAAPADEYRHPNRVQERLQAIEDARARADEPPTPAEP